MKNDMLVELIVRALPDMTTNELAELETAVNAELQDRYRLAREEYEGSDEDWDEGFDTED